MEVKSKKSGMAYNRLTISLGRDSISNSTSLDITSTDYGFTIQGNLSAPKNIKSDTQVECNEKIIYTTVNREVGQSFRNEAGNFMYDETDILIKTIKLKAVAEPWMSVNDEIQN